MAGPNKKLVAAAEAYFADLGRVRASVGATGERSYYPALAALLGAVGATLNPVYREANAGALRMEWPRVPLPAGRTASPKERRKHSLDQRREAVRSPHCSIRNCVYQAGPGRRYVPRSRCRTPLRDATWGATTSP